MSKISIICPLYNKISFIEATIQSVKEQSSNEWEMIIVDDGSTDGSYEFCETLIKNNPQFKLFKRTDFKENKGGSVCRNVGIQQATGDYILFLDADDLLEKDCVKNRLIFAEKYSQVNFFIFNEAYFYENVNELFIEKITSVTQKIIYLFQTNKKKYFLNCFLNYNLLWQTSCVLWSKELLEKIGGFNEGFQRLQDPEIHIRALCSNETKIKCLRYILKPDKYRRLGENRTQTSNTQKFTTHLNSIQYLINFFIPYLTEQKLKHITPLLLGYIFSFECDLKRALIEKDANSLMKKDDILEKLNLLKKQFNITIWYRFNMFWFQFFLSFPLGNKLKIPALIYKLYYFGNVLKY